MKALKLALSILGALTLAVLLLWLTAPTNANAAENPYCRQLRRAGRRR